MGDNVVSNGQPGGDCRTCKQMRTQKTYWADPDKSRARHRTLRQNPEPPKNHASLRKTHCPQGHPYDEANTYLTPAGWRQCKACRKLRVMESWWRNREKRLAESKAWREANPERHRANLLRWNTENRERANLLSRLKKQRKRAAGTLTDADWALVLEVYGNACLACDKPEVTIDHVIPVSKGGRNEIDNVQPLCGRCNTSKGTKTKDYRPVPIAELLAAA